MKKAMVYVIALSLSLTALLTGCGEMRGTDGRTSSPTATPAQTVLPETMMPDPEDGVVRDSDGIITDGDSGTTDGNRTDDAQKYGAGTADSGKTSPGPAQSGMR